MPSKIEWTDETWNPVSGCTKVSPGCANCYAERIHNRFGQGPFSEVRLHPERLTIPLRWKRPRMIFLCSMSDLFHPRVSWAFIDQVFRVMREASRHTFLILTKRPGRMAYYAEKVWPAPWPLNVWAGVSVESQKYAPRLSVLARVPAPVRFVSCEPLLGPLDLRLWLTCGICDTQQRCLIRGRLVNGVIVSGESGPGYRLMEVAWVEDIVVQCKGVGVPVFTKQDSASRPGQQGRIPDRYWLKEWPSASDPHPGGPALLDGREWRGVP